MQNESLEKLAVALGLTAENLWVVLVSQAPITAISRCLVLGIPLLLMLIVSRLDPAKMALVFEDDDRKEATDFLTGIRGGLIGACALIFTAMAIDATPIVLAGIFNPEYLALREILDALD